MRGGGNFITESYPTNFHTFCRQKMLSPGESVDDFREVSEKEKEAIEAKDALWVMPEQWLVDRFNYLANMYKKDYGGLNTRTGFFELGTVKDLSNKDALDIVLSPQGIEAELQISNLSQSGFMNYSNIRAIFPVSLSTGGVGASNFNMRFYNCAKLEEAIFYSTGWGHVGSFFRAFYGCRKLRVLKVMGGPANTKDATEAFSGCTALETLYPPYTVVGFDLRSCPKLNSDSIDVIIERTRQEGVIHTLHPDAYARVTEEQFAAAVAKNITIAST